MIKEEFLRCTDKYTNDNELREMWDEVEKNYSKPNRYYHNLDHLDSLLAELRPHKDKFDNWDTIVFAITYHDLIYNTLKTNNEERSAKIATKRLTQIAVPHKLITHCNQLILATKKHEPSDYPTNLFTDADLSILGSNPDTYKAYSKQIRREYLIYPNLVYYPGRKKVLAHFLQMKSIYKTREFSERYELNAKANIKMELDMLENGDI